MMNHLDQEIKGNIGIKKVVIIRLICHSVTYVYIYIYISSYFCEANFL